MTNAPELLIGNVLTRGQFNKGLLGRKSAVRNRAGEEVYQLVFLWGVTVQGTRGMLLREFELVNNAYDASIQLTKDEVAYAMSYFASDAIKLGFRPKQDHTTLERFFGVSSSFYYIHHKPEPIRRGQAVLARIKTLSTHILLDHNLL